MQIPPLNILPPPLILHLAQFHSQHLPRQDLVHPRQRHPPQHVPNQLRPPICRHTLPHPTTPTIAFPIIGTKNPTALLFEFVATLCTSTARHSMSAGDWRTSSSSIARGRENPCQVGFNPRVDGEVRAGEAPSEAGDIYDECGLGFDQGGEEGAREGGDRTWRLMTMSISCGPCEAKAGYVCGGVSDVVDQDY